MPYIGKSPHFGVRNRFIYTATGDETSKSGADDNGATLTFTDGAYVDVYLNGVLLKPDTDYVTTTANTIGSLSALSTNDILEVIVYDVFSVSDTVSATSGGTFSAGVNIDGGVVINESSADVDFRVESNGDANMLFVDGGNNRVGIGTGTPAEALEVKTSSSPAIQLNQGGDYQGIIRLAGNDLEIRSSSGQMEFYTGSADGDSSTERMRITDAGKVGIGTTPSTGFHVSLSAAGDHISTINNASSSAPYVLNLKTTAAATDDNSRTFIMCEDSSATRCLIYADGDIKNHDGTYGTISDERIKQDITDAKSQWDDIKGMTFKNFKKKDDVRQYGADKAPIHLGLIAQELEKVSPNLVDENEANVADIESSSEFGTLYENGDEIPENKQIGDVKERKTTVKGIKYSILYLKAVKALQEAMTRIETLEAKVKTLEDA